jgi:transcriptional regulator with GAF, ATPase, and Fis domain
LVRNAVNQRRLVAENLQLREKVVELSLQDEIVGESPQVKKILEMIDTVAQTDATVMIRGESGTGKELVAQAIHGKSNRRYFPIISINCGAFPEGLLESELFGHEKGAFTGAQHKRKGKLEMANGAPSSLTKLEILP